MNVSEKLDELFKLQSEIFQLFGFERQWINMGIEDSRQYYWHNDGTNKILTLYESYMQNVIASESYLIRSRLKNVYRSKDGKFSMIISKDFRCENLILRILDNDKEIKYSVIE